MDIDAKFELAGFYKQVRDSNLFDGNNPYAQQVNNEIKQFAAKRMEELLGSSATVNVPSTQPSPTDQLTTIMNLIQQVLSQGQKTQQVNIPVMTSGNNINTVSQPVQQTTIKPINTKKEFIVTSSDKPWIPKPPVPPELQGAMFPPDPNGEANSVNTAWNNPIRPGFSPETVLMNK
jgi:hypothetical protein